MEFPLNADAPGVALAEATTRESTQGPMLNVRFYLPKGTAIVQMDERDTEITTIFGRRVRVVEFTMGLN